MTIRPFEFEIYGEVRQGGSKFNMKKLKKKTFDIKDAFFFLLSLLGRLSRANYTVHPPTQDAVHSLPVRDAGS